ncbi:MAG TPA: arginine/agmatine antiporter [Dyella sp.]|uniref:arginine/agmatine antiporter n=1 Tax=Dyella sp. TaxID=1869338 RepID=UPI002D76B2AE|nr:arginine/agmatine antiporter [Dyella sp.]HET6552760.1 arginine/agmatine antiporter [Dyella sp.]
MAEPGKIGVVAATLMVAGNIMGSGIFMLPANLAATGGIAIFGWLVTILGAVSLAMTYSKLTGVVENSAGGSYAFARKSFGDFSGYEVNVLYWLGSWVGNVAMVVVGVGYLTFFLPILKQPLMAAFAGIAVMWLFTFINILGPMLTTRVQSVAIVLAMIPIVGVAVFGWLEFSSGTYMAAWNVSGHSAMDAVQGTLNVTLWSFIGVETASVAAAVVENPKRNIPIATVGGVLIAAVLYVASCTAIMGMIPNSELAKSDSPFADAIGLVLGRWGAALVAFCAAAGCLGSLGGWTLVVGQTAKAAADDGLFPPVFAKINAAGTPAKGLIIVAVAMSIIMLLTISPSASKQFGVISSISVIFTLVAYLYTAGALFVLARGKWGKHGVVYIVFGVITVIYSAWAILGSDSRQVVWAFILTLLTTLLYARNLGRRAAHPETNTSLAGLPAERRQGALP